MPTQQTWPIGDTLLSQPGNSRQTGEKVGSPDCATERPFPEFWPARQTGRTPPRAARLPPHQPRTSSCWNCSTWIPTSSSPPCDPTQAAQDTAGVCPRQPSPGPSSRFPDVLPSFAPAGSSFPPVRAARPGRPSGRGRAGRIAIPRAVSFSRCTRLVAPTA